MNRRSLASACLLFVACFRVDSASIPVRCDADNPCPDGLRCGEVGICISAAPQDMATPADQALASVGCVTGGQKLSDRVWACPGTFGIGAARSLCTQGWSVCKDTADLDPNYCASIASFFIGDLPAYKLADKPLDCASTTIYQRLFGGCGQCNSFPCATIPSSCTKFQNLAVDQSGGFDFGMGHSLDKAINKNPAAGVLCCRP